jgi:hypothetical protein
MKAVIGRLFRRFDSEEHKREIEEELCFHLELLTQEHLQQDVSLAEAKDAALKRFGNVDLVKDQCLETGRRSHPLMPAMRLFLIAVFLAGVLVRINSTDRNVENLGNLLIAVPSLCRLLFYVRSLNPSRFLSGHKTTSPLMLNETAQLPFTIYDHRKLTPVERVISDK